MTARHPDDPKIEDLKRALNEIWEDEKNNQKTPFDRFLNENSGEITNDTVKMALADYPDIDDKILSILTNVLGKIEPLKRNTIRPEVIIEKIYRKIHPSWYYTRFEKARIIGARALQISFGAPVLIDVPENQMDPINIALDELEKELIPITPIRVRDDERFPMAPHS